MNGFRLLAAGSAGASDYAARTDTLFWMMVLLSGGVALVITATALLFLIRYRRDSGASRAEPLRRGHVAELSWILIPLLLFVAIFVWAARLYTELFHPPPDALNIYVIGKQWMWKFQHANGKREYNELHVPAGRPVSLVMTSEDVIHSLFLPPLRIKRDLLPGRYSRIWFEATRIGEYRLFCAEYCGTAHSRMDGMLYVMEPSDYSAWLGTGEVRESLAAAGERLFREFGCSGCHGASATVQAPPLEGVFGKPVPLADGSTVIADERYVRDSILLPQKQVVAGYAPIMPSFQGQLGEEQILQLIAFIRSLGEEEVMRP